MGKSARPDERRTCSRKAVTTTKKISAFFFQGKRRERPLGPQSRKGCRKSPRKIKHCLFFRQSKLRKSGGRGDISLWCTTQKYGETKVLIEFSTAFGTKKIFPPSSNAISRSCFFSPFPPFSPSSSSCDEKWEKGTKQTKLFPPASFAFMNALEATHPRRSHKGFKTFPQNNCQRIFPWNFPVCIDYCRTGPEYFFMHFMKLTGEVSAEHFFPPLRLGHPSF